MPDSLPSFFAKEAFGAGVASAIDRGVSRGATDLAAWGTAVPGARVGNLRDADCAVFEAFAPILNIQFHNGLYDEGDFVKSDVKKEEYGQSAEW